MTPRTISYAAACLAAAATLSAAFAGSAAAISIAAPLLGASGLAAVVFGALHWRRGRQASAALDTALRAARESISGPDLGTIAHCPWCKDATPGPHPSHCTCTVRCDGIAWCAPNVARRMNA